MNTNRLLSTFLGLCLALASCNAVPEKGTPTQTVPAPPTETPIPLQTSTMKPSLPILTARTEVPCRAGPGEMYDLIVNLRVGEQAEIVGRAGTFWIVLPLESEQCWVADKKVNIEGEIASLPDVTRPATPTPALPAAPANLKLVDANCWIDKSKGPTLYKQDFLLAWTDMANNEDGFRLYRDGVLVAEVPANTEKVIDTSVVKNRRAFYYYVTAFNAIGETKSEVLTLSC